MDCAIGEVVNDPRVDSPKKHRLVVVRFLDLGNVVKHPAELDSSKVSRKRQAGLLLDSADAQLALLGQLLDHAGGAGVWPSNSARECLARVFVPDDSCLALVGNAHDLDTLARIPLLGLELLHCLVDAFVYAVHDLVRILILPPGMVKELGELLSVPRLDLRILVEDHKADRGCAGINRAHQFRLCGVVNDHVGGTPSNDTAFCGMMSNAGQDTAKAAARRGAGRWRADDGGDKDGGGDGEALKKLPQARCNGVFSREERASTPRLVRQRRHPPRPSLPACASPFLRLAFGSPSPTHRLSTFPMP